MEEKGSSILNVPTCPHQMLTQLKYKLFCVLLCNGQCGAATRADIEVEKKRNLL